MTASRPDYPVLVPERWHDDWAAFDVGASFGAGAGEVLTATYRITPNARTMLCGRIVVENGSVVEAEGLDESGRALFEHGFEDDVPTLAELLEQAAAAEAEEADIVEVESTDEGRPTAIDIDWDSNATDDEACYRIIDYRTAS